MTSSNCVFFFTLSYLYIFFLFYLLSPRPPPSLSFSSFDSDPSLNQPSLPLPGFAGLRTTHNQDKLVKSKAISDEQNMHKSERKATVRPCYHNDWDDVRTRKGYKVLRCRVCEERWKLPSRLVKRCMAFLHGTCKDGATCGMLHVRRKKSNILERYDTFGDSVLQGVARGIRKKTRRTAAEKPPNLVCSSGSSGSTGSTTTTDGPPPLLDEDLTPRSDGKAPSGSW
eukprot:TRINITY_DN10368_c0_g3_i1.p1 TRINITY_DN10368_c0_g3~~TRINITY_DN10368_c0_g3_i1.p1  ORF type:complete len:226 (+),score=8.22 TRINITY_DN10368_c0_g3_i1:252-929(+)